MFQCIINSFYKLLLKYNYVFVIENSLHTLQSVLTLNAQMNLQVQLSVTITLKPCFPKVGRRRWGFGSENKRERQIRIIVNSGED